MAYTTLSPHSPRTDAPSAKKLRKTSLRNLALTVEEAVAGEFRWRILEGEGSPCAYRSVACARTGFAAYDVALANGYGELQRLVGADLQFGPRSDVPGVAAGAGTDPMARPVPPATEAYRPLEASVLKPGMAAA